MARETEMQMAQRHVSEQEGRIRAQKALIERLRTNDLPVAEAEAFLEQMVRLLDQMQDHVARLA